jgi:hypothetical protein
MRSQLFILSAPSMGHKVGQTLLSVPDSFAPNMHRQARVLVLQEPGQRKSNWSQNRCSSTTPNDLFCVLFTTRSLPFVHNLLILMR